MKERLVRGSNLVDVARLIQERRDDRSLPELGPWEQDLLRKRVSTSTWYSFRVFDSLLQVVHRFVFDGSEAAARSMGRAAARAHLKDRPERFVVTGDPLATLQLMNARWRELFNFAEIAVTPLEGQASRHCARVRLSGYPDMSACHGQTILGWTLEIVERAGGKNPSLRLEERPWMHNSVLTYVVEWE
jgi:hypothetical protein